MLDPDAASARELLRLASLAFFLAAEKKSGILLGTVGSLRAVSLGGDRWQEAILCSATG